MDARSVFLRIVAVFSGWAPPWGLSRAGAEARSTRSRRRAAGTAPRIRRPSDHIMPPGLPMPGLGAAHVHSAHLLIAMTPPLAERNSIPPSVPRSTSSSSFMPFRSRIS